MPERQTFRLRDMLRALVSIRPGPWRWAVGVQIALVAGIPLLLFTLAGMQEAGLVASLGAFSALYGAHLPLNQRVRIVPVIGLFMLAMVALAVSTAYSLLLTSVALVLIALLSCLFIFGFRLGAPGPLMPVLVSAVAGHLAIAGTGISGHAITGWVAVGLVLSWVVLAIPLLLPSFRKGLPPLQSLRKVFGNPGLDQQSDQIARRVVAATVLGLLVGIPFGVDRIHWVVLAAIAIVQNAPDVTYTVVRGLQRMIGTLLGVLVFLGLTAVITPQGVAVALLVALLQGAIEVVVTKNYGLALLFMTPVALLITSVAGNYPAGVLAWERAVDTGLGGLVAFVVLFLGEWLRRRRLLRRLER